MEVPVENLVVLVGSMKWDGVSLIHKIKYIRAITGWDLKEARKFIEDCESGKPRPVKCPHCGRT